MAAKITLVLSESSVSVANNTSALTAKLYYYGNEVSYNNGGCSGYITIDGTKYTFSGATISKSTSAQLIATKSKTITHNANGAYTAKVSAQLATDTTAAGTLTTSASKVLTTIARASSISVNKTTVSVDGSTTITVTATKKSTSFTDTIVVTLGSNTETVTSGTAFTIPVAWLSAISGTSATATATVTTKSGSITIGSNSVSFTVTVPASVVPTISSIAVSEAVSKVKSNIGAYLKGQSQLNITITAKAETSAGIATGSAISNYSTTLDGITYVGSTFTSNVLKNYGTLTIKTTVTDKRGRSATKSQTVTVYDYASPTITAMSSYQCDADGTRNSDGTCTKIIVSGKATSVKVSSTEKNTKTLTLKYKAATATAYTTITSPTLSSWSFTAEKIISGTDPNTTYEFVATLTDKLNSATKSVKTAITVISRLAGGTGISFFEEASKAGFWVNSFAKIKGYIQTLIAKNPAIYMRTVDGSYARSGRILKNATTDSSGNEVDYGMYISDYTDSSNYTYLNVRDAASSNSYSLRLGICTDGTIASYPVLSTLLCKDYVVERGTSGIWTYRKWYSGIAECWGQVSLGDISLTTNMTTGVCSNSTYAAKSVTLPSGLFTSVKYANSNVKSNGYTSTQVSSYDTENITYRVWSSYSCTPTSVVVMLEVKGTWK